MTEPKSVLEAVQQFIDETPGFAGMYPGERFALCWGEPGVGFGEVIFVADGDKVGMYTESMGKEFVKKMLCRMVDEAEILD